MIRQSEEIASVVATSVPLRRPIDAEAGQRKEAAVEQQQVCALRK